MRRTNRPERSRERTSTISTNALDEVLPKHSLSFDLLGINNTLEDPLFEEKEDIDENPIDENSFRSF